MERNLAAELDAALRVEASFDLQKRSLRVAGGRGDAAFYSLAGALDGERAMSVLQFALACPRREDAIFALPHPDVSHSDDVAVLTDAVLAGRSVLVVEGVDRAAIIDCKSDALRAVSEPENDRVLRGPRDGFSESLVRNTSLIRRRLRDPALTVERYEVGRVAKADVALCYLCGKADPVLVRSLQEKLSPLPVDALNMTQESLAEQLVPRGWWNPFPKVRYSERPDAAAAMLEEGSVVLLCDNTPQAMILPTAIFDFLQESDDFYLPPLVGSYLRLVRLGILLLSLVLTPLWYYGVTHVASLPAWLRFLDVKEPAAVPLLLQLLLAELMIDGLKLASLNTPNMLNNSLSVVGGLILGDYAVEAGWFSSQTILYMAVVAIASFTQQSYELGYAIKFFRLLTLLLVALLGLPGLFLGLLLTVLAVASNRTVAGGRSYLYPLIPFDGKAMGRLLLRRRRR